MKYVTCLAFALCFLGIVDHAIAAPAPSRDRILAIQTALRMYKVYEGPADGSITPELTAIAQRVLGTSSTEVDWDALALVIDYYSRDPSFNKLFARLASLREDAAASTVAWTSEYAPMINEIQASNGFTSIRQAQQALSFFMRAAVLIPVHSSKDHSSFLFYNPVLDVALAISIREGASASPKIEGTLAPGEMTRVEAVKGFRPGWMDGGDILRSIQAKSQKTKDSNIKSYGAVTSAGDPARDLRAMLRIEKNAGRTAAARIGVGAMAASNKELPCGKQIDEKAVSVDTLKSIGKANIQRVVIEPGSDTSLYPVGGASDSKQAIKFYAPKKDPYSLFSVWFDNKTGTCAVLDIIPIKVFSESI